MFVCNAYIWARVVLIYICLDLQKGTSRNFQLQSHLRLVQYLIILFFIFNDIFSTKIPQQTAVDKI